MIDLERKKAVFFDFGDTLVTTIETYPKRIELAFVQSGYSFKEGQFIKAYLTSDYEIFKHYKKHGSIDQNEHRNLLYKLLVKNLDLGEDYTVVKSKIKKTLGKINHERKKIEGCDYVLSRLKEKNFILAIISNNDGRTADKCKNTKIDHYFDIIIDSTKVKMVKPDVKIFNYALNKLGLKKEEVIHIGDLYGSDILGAVNAGIDPIWINHRKGENFENLDITTVKNLQELSFLVT